MLEANLATLGGLTCLTLSGCLKSVKGVVVDEQVKIYRLSFECCRSCAA